MKLGSEMIHFLSNGGFGKFIILVVQFIYLIGAGGLVGYEIFNNQQPNQFLLAGIMYLLFHSGNLAQLITSKNEDAGQNKTPSKQP